MRLWHKYLIPYLPRKQLIAQWRECCCIARSIHKNGTPNHILVNKIINYPDDEFNTYAMMVAKEMEKRGYTVDKERFWRWRRDSNTVLESTVFRAWHDQRYLCQCYHNLEEKHDCGGVSEEEWKIFERGYKTYSRR